MQGSVVAINKALFRPLLIAGVEKRLMVVNALVSFLMTAATHFYLPQALIGAVVFILLHCIFRLCSKHDPFLALIFKRFTRYGTRVYFPALSHPLMLNGVDVRSVATV